MSAPFGMSQGSSGSTFLAQSAMISQSVVGGQNSSGQSAVITQNPIGPSYTTIYAQGPEGTRPYDFPNSAIEKYPGLSDPGVRFIRLEQVYPLLCGQPITSIEHKHIEDADDRQRFLYACQFVGYQLSPEEQALVYELSGAGQVTRDVRKWFDSMGAKVDKYLNEKGRLRDFQQDVDDILRSAHPDCVSAGIKTAEILDAVRRKSDSWLAKINSQFPGVCSLVIKKFGQKMLGKFLQF